MKIAIQRFPFAPLACQRSAFCKRFPLSIICVWPEFTEAVEARERQAEEAERQGQGIALPGEAALVSAWVQLEPSELNFSLLNAFLLLLAEPVTARKDDAPAAVQAAMANVAGLGASSVGGGLIQTTSGCRQQRVDRDHRRGFCWRACS